MSELPANQVRAGDSEQDNAYPVTQGTHGLREEKVLSTVPVFERFGGAVFYLHIAASGSRFEISTHRSTSLAGN
jgi:hypothetical protein